MADDSQQVRALVLALLDVAGIGRISTARDADETWSTLHAFAPDLLITDWNMPPTSGLDLVRRLRRDAASPNRFLPVIMLSAYGEEHRIRAARFAGVTEFLVKPVSANTFLDRLHAVIEDKRPFVETTTYFGPDRRRGLRPPWEGPDRRGGRP